MVGEEFGHTSLGELIHRHFCTIRNCVVEEEHRLEAQRPN